MKLCIYNLKFTSNTSLVICYILIWLPDQYNFGDNKFLREMSAMIRLKKHTYIAWTSIGIVCAYGNMVI